MATKGKDYVLRLNQIQDDRRVVAPMCKTHFAKQPMRIEKGVKQYVYDATGAYQLANSLYKLSY